MKNILSTIILFTVLAVLFTACNKDKVETPVAEEQELITTLRITVTDTVSGSSSTFNYKIENGFNGYTPSVVYFDTIKLSSNKTYTYSISVLNEKATPAEDVTSEVISENDEHLFILVSDPASGAGAITVSNGNKDNNNDPFNQEGMFITDAAGTGTLTLTLIHTPIDKNAATTAGTGGETDAEAVFPVVLQ